MPKIPRNMLLIFVFVICFASNASSQTSKEVPKIQEIGSRNFRCYPMENKIVDQESFEKIKENENCSSAKLLKVDFSKQTLISYRVGGDCFMKVTTDVFRNDDAKTYTVHLNNYWGKCRAGGSFQGFLVIEKIPTDYKVDFNVNLLGEFREKDNFFSIWTTDIQKPPAVKYNKLVESSEADLKNCIQMIFQEEFIIKNKADYLTKLSNDVQKQSCTEYAEILEFEKYSYVGKVINSGYCQRPEGLQHEFIKIENEKKFALKIKYVAPQYGGCRAKSHYEFWVRVPKISEDQTIEFVIEPQIFVEEN